MDLGDTEEQWLHLCSPPVMSATHDPCGSLSTQISSPPLSLRDKMQEYTAEMKNRHFQNHSCL